MACMPSRWATSQIWKVRFTVPSELSPQPVSPVASPAARQTLSAAHASLRIKLIASFLLFLCAKPAFAAARPTGYGQLQSAAFAVMLKNWGKFCVMCTIYNLFPFWLCLLYDSTDER